MILHSLFLQYFRNYTSQKFDFSPKTTIVIGPNTAGKTNLVESISLLSQGKSFKGQDEEQVIQFGKEIARVQGLISSQQESLNSEPVKLEVAVLSREANQGRFGKKFFVNGVAKSRFKFMGNLPLVLFRPEELDIIIAGPGRRRDFLDEVLEQADRDYYHAVSSYEKALRQRNALLTTARETGIKNHKQFVYWDNLIIEHGSIITEKRQACIAWLTSKEKDIFDFKIVYDPSSISKERLAQYEQAEIGAGVTLVGPHRDDFILLMERDKNVRDFGSRGQQRLAVLQLKLLQIAYVEEKLQQRPLLVLDDIFSELDTEHIAIVLERADGGQRIITTTHKEFVDASKLNHAKVIEL